MALKPLLFTSALVFSAVPLVAAPAPKPVPPSETAVVIADNLEKPTWRVRAAVKWRVARDQPTGFLIEGWDFSGCVGAMPRGEIKDRVMFPKIERGAKAWLDVPGEHFVLIEDCTPVKKAWDPRGTLDIDGKIINTGYHWLQTTISEWKHPKKRFEFFIRDVSDAGEITDANLKINDNGTITSSGGTIQFVIACPDGATVYTRGRFWLGLGSVELPMRKHGDWEEKGRTECSTWLTVEWVVTNKR
ncbi:hypothetical protein [Frigoriglobus tundricola]|uniref:Uncharacterized protein n=1 Tax=Frigoriglobus tundricola TaxID=2774151 RepID=A0A6M5YNC7_9BACT|nr:hypothetical protein [Frigoriglobus tundricola]QJW95428.1 hypothetical protein FTUN_2977 [Frigoriglobus tundricola]